MGAAVSDADQEGIRCPDLGEDLRGGGSGGHSLQVRDMSNDTAHWEVFGRIPPQGGPHTDREKTSERAGGWMGVSTSGGID